MLCLNTPTKSRNRLTQKKQDCPTVRLRRQSLNRMRFLNPKSLPTTDLNDVHTSWIQALGSPGQHPSPSCQLLWLGFLTLFPAVYIFSSVLLSTLPCRTRKNGQPHCPARAAAAAAKSLQSCLTLRPHGWQPTRLPHLWDSLGKNTGVGCHFLLQCMKVKSEREVAQSCLTLSDLMDCSLPGFSIHGIFQAVVLEWGCHCLLRAQDEHETNPY